MRKAAVAIIIRDGYVLMGLATSSDFRYGKWCFIGGGIEQGETPSQAAVRESREESNLIVQAQPGETYIVNDKDSVVYVVCDYVSGEPIPNNEFFELAWFKLNNIPEGMNILELNLKILEKLFS